MVVKNRGIQKGTQAGDALSKALDHQCKVLRQELSKVFPELVMKKKLKKQDIPFGVGACAPDGGLWFKDGKLVVAIEGKKQGDGGNAIERWYKNHYICREINPEVSYITFAVGPGANTVIRTTLNIAHEGNFNQYIKGKNSCFISEEGFTIEQMRDIMQQVLKDYAEYSPSNLERSFE